MTNTNTTPKLQKKGHLADTQHVAGLISNYKKERWSQNSARLGKADSLSTWYGLDELLSFLQLARENQADGIKMYYGVYPDNYEKVPEFQGRQTVVLVATKQKATQRGILNKEIYINKEGRAEILAFNYGTLCPPFCSGYSQISEDGLPGMDMSKIGISIIQQKDQIIVI